MVPDNLNSRDGVAIALTACVRCKYDNHFQKGDQLAPCEHVCFVERKVMVPNLGPDKLNHPRGADALLPETPF